MNPLSDFKRLLSNPAVAVLVIGFGGLFAYRAFQRPDGWVVGALIGIVVLAIGKNAVDRAAKAKKNRDFERRWDDM